MMMNFKKNQNNAVCSMDCKDCPNGASQPNPMDEPKFEKSIAMLHNWVMLEAIREDHPKERIVMVILPGTGGELLTEAGSRDIFEDVYDEMEADLVADGELLPALVYLTQATHEKISRYTISSKDVYISIAGTIGQVGAIPDSIDGANLTENAAKIVLNEGAPVDRDYLIWYLSLPAGAEQIEEKTMHTTQPKLALYRIEEIEVLVPPIAEQRSFAAFVQQSDKSKLLISRLKEFILMGYRGHGKM